MPRSRPAHWPARVRLAERLFAPSSRAACRTPPASARGGSAWRAPALRSRAASDRVREPWLEATEDGEAEQEEEDGHRYAHRHLAPIRLGLAEERPAPARDHAGHGVERKYPLPLHRDLIERVHHAGNEREDLQEHRDHVGHVSPARGEGRE